MKFYAIKLAAFGIAGSALFAAIVAGLAQLASLGFPQVLRLPSSIYVLAGFPLTYILSLVLTDETMAHLFGDDAALAASFVMLLASSFVTWSLFFSLLRHVWLRKRGAVA